ncbi:MAG: hypothetical protein AB7O21_11260 [Gammaproteobacteria bacterium]
MKIAIGDGRLVECRRHAGEEELVRDVWQCRWLQSVLKFSG